MFVSHRASGEWDPLTFKFVLYFLSLVLFFLVGILFYGQYEGWTAETSIGFAVVTLSTVGYGYTYPSDDTSRLFTIFYMLFGVYFIFFGINDLITHRMNNMKKKGTGAEKVSVSRKRFFFNVLAIFSILVVAAITLMILEDWTFIKALYFIVQTTATIGFGDIERPSKRARIFLWGYIIICAGLVAYLFSNLNIVKNGMKLLSDKEKRAQKLLNLEFVLSLDASGQGVTQAEFILAVLEHEGIISKEKNITPWAEKFNVLDQMRTGRLHRKELEEFYRIESRLAASTMEDIQREKDEASLAAITAVWPNFDEPNEDGPTTTTRSSSRDHGNMWGGRIANPLQQRTFSSGTNTASNSSSDTRGASLVVSGMTGMYNAQSLSEQTEPMLSSYDYQEEDC